MIPSLTRRAFAHFCGAIFLARYCAPIPSARAKSLNARRGEFIADGILWRVDYSAGAIFALHPETQTPLWSPSGRVFRFTAPDSVRDVENAAFFCAANGRAYFLLRDVASRFVSATNAKTLPPLTLALALDPRAQGRVVWFRRAEEFCNILNDNEDEKIFSGAPQFAETAPVAQENDVVVILQAGARSRKLILFASDGVARR